MRPAESNDDRRSPETGSPAQPAYDGSIRGAMVDMARAGLRELFRRAFMADLGQAAQSLPGAGQLSQEPPPDAGQRPRQPHTATDQLREAGGSRLAAVAFWEALDPAEQQALKSVATRKTFAAGVRIMVEGEPADFLIVIIEGWTRICVDENGWERFLAERGPGELIGERGGLQVRVRSASVVAIETVRALVVTTRDFTAFVTAFPRVLGIVESQVYDRLTEDQTAYQGPGIMPAGRRPAGTGPGGGLAVNNAEPPLLIGQNCVVLLSDVVDFGSPDRNDEDRRIIRDALYSMTRMMLHSVPGARPEDRGDGLLIVMPPNVPTAQVITLLRKELGPALDLHNRTHRESARIQLRVAVNVGPVTTDTLGVSGEAIIIAARLVEAPIFKAAISKSAASLGVIVSPFVYETSVRHSLNPIDLMDYSEIQIEVKGYAAAAWMKLFEVPALSSRAYNGARHGAARDSYRGFLRAWHLGCGAQAHQIHRHQHNALPNGEGRIGAQRANRRPARSRVSLRLGSDVAS
jgi:CRP-like cAMP-binding protein